MHGNERQTICSQKHLFLTARKATRQSMGAPLQCGIRHAQKLTLAKRSGNMGHARRTSIGPQRHQAATLYHRRNGCHLLTANALRNIRRELT